MKQLIQSYKTGELGIFELPPPACGERGVLVRTTASLVSAGTEKMIVDLAKKSLIGKAQARPDLVKQVIQKMKQEGIRNTLKKVFTKLDTPIPLGYSCAGNVIEVGSNLSGVSIGDRVACGGAGYASHSEINYIPRNLFVKIPDGVDDADASFVTVGAIALQGVRQTDPAIGENIAVIGLGLIGQLTVQLLKANGCRVLGVDIDSDRLELAMQLGADAVCNPDDLLQTAGDFSNGFGVDAVIITASTQSNQPIVDAGEISRMKGRVVVVGMVGMDIPRNSYYKKELELRLSMAYGPGRYDPQYEEHGIDYPYAYVRWTEQRNFEAFLGLVAEGKITPKKLVTHRFDFAEALKAYDLLEGKTKEKYLGIVLTYSHESGAEHKKSITISSKSIGDDKIAVGLIGAGNFTKAVMLPALKKFPEFALAGLCTATGISAHATGTKYGFKHITTDSNAIFDNPEINTIFVTTRHNTHAEYVLRALRAGKHVFVEKPLCITMQELEEIREAYELRAESQELKILMVGFNRRFSPLVQQMKQALGDMPMSIIYRVNAGVIPRESWIQDSEIGGGRIIGEVCHFIDTCSFLAGADPIDVYASCVRKGDASVADEDNVSIILTYPNGSIATIVYCAYGDRQMPKEHIELFCPNSAMQMNDFRELTVYRGGKKQMTKSANQDKGFTNELEAFRNAVKSGKAAIPLQSIFATTAAAFKVLESLRTKSAISL